MLERIKRPPFDFPISATLEHDILEVIKCHDTGDMHLYDCYVCEVIGSVNADYACGALSKEQADWIREYYGYGGINEDID